MKFTKFIPVALALTLAAPAFSAPLTEAQSVQSITVSPFFNIAYTSTKETTSATFNDSYNVITLGDSLNASFHVITNVPTDKVYLTAYAKEDGNALTKALGGAPDASSLKIVFTNDSVTNGAPAGAIADCLGSPTIAGNPDAIAFTLTPTVTADSDSGMSAAPTGALASNVVTYSFTKAGEVDFLYTMGTSALSNTFSTHDTAGTYKATIKMSHAAL